MKLQKFGDQYDQTSQNGREDLEECFKSSKKGKYNDLSFKSYETPT
jgi:hypothetical protein